MKPVRAPRTLAQATELLGRYAEVDGQLASVEAARRRMMGRINAKADATATPLLDELKAIAAVIAPWWAEGGKALAPKGAKSMQLGGCMLGTRASAARLAHGYANDAAACDALLESRYAKATTIVTYAIDRKATLKLVQGESAAGKALALMGFKAEAGEAFFVRRVEQSGVIAAA